MWYVAKLLDDHNGTFSAFSAAAVAVFTWFLYKATISLRESTDKLWDAGERQLKLIGDNAAEQSKDTKASIAVAERSARAAEEAAKAASLNAKAAINAKLPHVHVVKIELFEPGPPYGRNADAFKTQVFEGRPPNHAQIAIRFGNLGETNAFIVGMCFEYFVGPRLDRLPTHERILPFAETVIEAKGEFEFAPGLFFLSFTDEQSRTLDMQLYGQLWVYGYISYLDFIGGASRTPLLSTMD